jgi:hypothetical protein
MKCAMKLFVPMSASDGALVREGDWPRARPTETASTQSDKIANRARSTRMEFPRECVEGPIMAIGPSLTQFIGRFRRHPNRDGEQQERRPIKSNPAYRTTGAQSTKG